MNGMFSDWANVMTGVPQGTMFSPLLSLSYVNDLNPIIKNSTIKLFADDVLPYVPANTQQEYFALQDDLTAISKLQKTVLNIAKCAINNKWNPINFTYCINGQSVSCQTLLLHKCQPLLFKIKFKLLNCYFYIQLVC